MGVVKREEEDQATMRPASRDRNGKIPTEGAVVEEEEEEEEEEEDG